MTGDIGLREVAVDDKQGAPIVRIPKLSLGLASVEPLARKVHLSRIALESPELTVRREKTGITNIETLLPKPAPTQTPPDKAAAAPAEAVALDVDEISITGAKVFFSDLFPRVPFKTTLAPIDVKVRQLSTRPNTKGTYNLTLATEAKEQIALEGSMALAPVVVEGKVDLKAVALKKYAPYYSDMILLRHRNRKARSLDPLPLRPGREGAGHHGVRGGPVGHRSPAEAAGRAGSVRPGSGLHGAGHRDRRHPAAGHRGRGVHPEGFRGCEAAGRWEGGSPAAHGPAAGRPGRGRGRRPAPSRSPGS